MSSNKSLKSLNFLFFFFSLCLFFFFFFKQKTAYEIYQCDWSSDVCSSDLEDDVRVSTVEQPAVADEDPSLAGGQVVPQSPSGQESGVVGDFWNALTRGGVGWMGWVRGFLTTGALVVMLFVLFWALGELFDSFGAVLDGFDVGSSGDPNS